LVLTYRYGVGVAKRVFLHVGFPKSGTTYLQQVLSVNKQQLAQRADLLYPGEDWHDQVLAVKDLRKLHVWAAQRDLVRGAWPRLAHEINAWHGDAVMSMEWLCRAEHEHIRRVVEDLRPAQVEVVFTVRELGRTLMAGWQESVQNRKEWSWDEFLDGVTATDPRATAPGRRFWGLHDTNALLRHWSEVVETSRLHLVTVAPTEQSPTLLWDRFCSVLEIDPSGHDTENVNTNASLGLESTELLRLLNQRTRQLPRSVRRGIVTGQLAKRGLNARRDAESRLAVHAGLYDWLASRAEADISGIRSSGIRVVGDLDELRPDASVTSGVRPDELSPESLLDAALDALVIAVERWGAATLEVARQEEVAKRRDGEVRRLTRKNARLRASNTLLESRLWTWQSRPLRTALARMTRR
jgi:hypothetical protein